jgi:3-deoxy-D-manno-octulosonate 8-phosphate phosphatase (KDO 8-P phosphatase)
MNNIKYLVMDVDGTLTDGKIYIGASGEVFKAFNVKDGYGIHTVLKRHGITPIIITGRMSDIVKARCRELEITRLYQGVNDKRAKLIEIIAESEYSSVAYIGDDENDMAVMQFVSGAGGLVGCPNDAVGKVKEIADFVSIHNGGEGAVRDFIEYMVEN